jgi:hypothetical protein
MKPLEHNVGRIDAGVRYVAAAVLFAISLLFNDSPGISLVSALAALVMAATAISGRCPLYTILGINTCTPHPRANR